jgi:hypothetical protein
MSASDTASQKRLCGESAGDAAICRSAPAVSSVVGAFLQVRPKERADGPEGPSLHCFAGNLPGFDYPVDSDGARGFQRGELGVARYEDGVCYLAEGGRVAIRIGNRPVSFDVCRCE